MSEMRYTTGICANCGADDGLHHYKTMQCHKNGIEEWRPNKVQDWQCKCFNA